MVIGLILVFATIVTLQVPRLVRKKLWRELVIFFTLFTLGAIYSLGQIYHWALPNPTKRMEYLFVPAWNMLEKIVS